MESIDVTPLIVQFDEHLKVNDRTILSARFGDGKSWFLDEFMASQRDDYEFVVLYPVNYQIAPNEAIMEYIKRDILFQLILKGYLKPGVTVPDPILFQWYISQKSSVLFTDVMQILASLPEIDTEWKTALSALLSISGEITRQVDKFREFKHNMESEDDFAKAAQIIESLSAGAGNLYELDVVSYLIISTLQKIKETGKQTVLVIEDLDRIDPAHLFRILNVFSAHIDRVYQYSDRTVTDANGAEIPVDTLKNKFGFDKVIMVLDEDTTCHIFHHFYGDNANYLGYISKFITHNTFHYSISEYALQQLVVHLRNKCGLTLDNITSKDAYGVPYVHPNDLSVRKIAQMLDAFNDSIHNTIVAIDDNQTSFLASTNLTRAISTLRRLGMSDVRILLMLKGTLSDEELVGMMGGFLIKQIHVNQGYNVYYKGCIYYFETERKANGVVIFRKCTDRELRDAKNHKELEVNVDEAFTHACQYVK